MLHPIVASINPSPDQRPAIAERSRDVAVVAGAGSGKTRTLVARYLALLADGIPARNCLAITFTRKAAREMRNRVRKVLSDYLRIEGLDEGERARWRRIYAELDAARISTIHSLCSELLAAHPAEAGVDPQFTVLDEGLAAIMRREAVDEAIAWAAEDPDAVVLFALAGERDMRRALDAMLDKRLETAACFEGLPEDLWPVWEAELLGPVQALLDDAEVNDAFSQLLEVRDNGEIERALAKGDGLAEPLQALLMRWERLTACAEQEDWPAVVAEVFPLVDEMPSTQGRKEAWKPVNPKDILKSLKPRCKALLGKLAEKPVDLAWERRLAEAMAAWRSLFLRADATYRGLKAERQALDFDDQEEKARRLLEECPAARARWQAEAAAILVDEFQDTNERQRSLLKQLRAAPGRFFMVGDAKQSIYRFRGADVAVFQNERQTIIQDGGRELVLGRTYRAHAGLVDAIGQFLRPMLGEDDPARPWRAGFIPLVADRAAACPGFDGPPVELHVALGSKGEGALDRAANALAHRLIRMVEDDGLQVRGQDGNFRALNYGDIVILCQASRSFETYENALERAGVPFLTVAGRGFYGRPEVRDVLNALRAVADPWDDVALAGLLRSPAVALTDASLFLLHLRAEELGPGSGLWDALRSPGESLPPAEAARVQRAVSLIERLNGLVGRVSVAELLKTFLDLTDYRAALLAAGQRRAARNVGKLLTDAHAVDLVSVGEFLEYIAALKDSDTRESEARALAEGVVQLMSVHAAKGLEFPVVVIGDANHEPSASRQPPLLHPQWGVLLALKSEADVSSFMYRLGRAAEQEREDAEDARLLYVASTRAKERLILSGCLPLNQSGTVKRGAGWLVKIAGPDGVWPLQVPSDDGTAPSRTVPLPAGEPVACCEVYLPRWSQSRRAVQAEGNEPAADFEWPDLPGEDAPAAAEGARTEGAAPPRVWRVVPSRTRARAPAWVVGSLVHDALAGWQFPGSDGFGAWAASRARNYGIVDEGELADAVAEASRLLNRFRLSPLYLEMAAADQRLHEAPYSLVLDGGVESGIIDTLYRVGEQWTIVEFKTDDIRDEAALQRLLAEGDYLQQTQRYAAAVRGVLNVAPRSLLCLLNFAGTVRVEKLDLEPA